jgi:hypothetical protein
MKKTIRVIRTYEVQVKAEYGDTEESLVAKGIDAVSDGDPEFVETAVLLPDDDETPADESAPEDE